MRILTCWYQIEEVFWFTICFDLEKYAKLPKPSFKSQKFKVQLFTQLRLRCSFYCTSYNKGNLALYMFIFDTKTFIIRLVIDDVTVVNMWSYESLLIVKMEFLGRIFESFLMIPIYLFAFKT